MIIRGKKQTSKQVWCRHTKLEIRPLLLKLMDDFVFLMQTFYLIKTFLITFVPKKISFKRFHKFIAP